MRKIMNLIGVMAIIICLAGTIHAHSINGVNSTSAGKIIEFGSLTLTSGSGSVSLASGSLTFGMFMPDYNAGAGTTTTFKVLLSGTTATFYAYNGMTGATSTSNFTGKYLVGE